MIPGHLGPLPSGTSAPGNRPFVLGFFGPGPAPGAAAGRACPLVPQLAATPDGHGRRLLPQTVTVPLWKSIVVIKAKRLEFAVPAQHSPAAQHLTTDRYGAMATSAIAIVEGRVLRRDHREGVKEGRPWSMDILTVLVADTGTTELIVPRDLSVVGGHDVKVGDNIRWTVEVVRSERGFNLNVVGVTASAVAQKHAA